MKYKSGMGFPAFLLHRGAGILLALFILPHLYILYFLKDPSKYEAIRGFCAHPAVRLTEVFLLALVLAHGLNGIRLMLLEAGVPSRFQKALFGAAAIAWFLLLVAGARLMFLR